MYIYIKIDVITHACFNFIGGLAEVRYGWVITSNCPFLRQSLSLFAAKPNSQTIGTIKMLTVSAGQIINFSPGQGTKPAFRQCKVLEKRNIKNKLTHKLCDENIRHAFVQYKEVFVEENTFENIVCKMAAISSRPQCDIIYTLYHYGVQTC